MLLVAQRVVSVAHKIQGVNAYRYSHRYSRWPTDPTILFDDPNKMLARKRIQLRPGGNRVISFLDVVAPDDMDVADLVHVLNEFSGQPQPPVFPVCKVSGPCAVRFAIGENIIPAWRDEIEDLIKHLLITQNVPKD